MSEILATQQSTFVPLTSEQIALLTPAEQLSRAEGLFKELPYEIQDPINREGFPRNPVWVSNIEIDQPSITDMIALGHEDMAKYLEVAELAKKCGVPMRDIHLRAYYERNLRHYNRYSIPEKLRPESRTSKAIHQISAWIKEKLNTGE
jgi:hypothetical protein